VTLVAIWAMMEGLFSGEEFSDQITLRHWMKTIFAN
jgi:hypothetical protein